MNTEIRKDDALKLVHKIDYETGKIISKDVISEGAGTVTLLALDEGTLIARHSVTADVLIQVLEGKAVINIGGHAHTVETGQAMLLAPDTLHEVYAEECCKILLTKISL
ncbi:MAG: cupin domain-containing protein [Muribaculaceae bacterium]|nr:cupin domain-containing protein [Muribaculaceae bacterium]